MAALIPSAPRCHALSILVSTRVPPNSNCQDVSGEDIKGCEAICTSKTLHTISPTGGGQAKSDIVGPDRDSEVESQNQLPHYLERQAIKNEVQMMPLASRNGESDSRRG